MKRLPHPSFASSAKEGGDFDPLIFIFLIVISTNS